MSNDAFILYEYIQIDVSMSTHKVYLCCLLLELNVKYIQHGQWHVVYTLWKLRLTMT